jgi:hypothetical protein
MKKLDTSAIIFFSIIICIFAFFTGQYISNLSFVRAAKKLNLKNAATFAANKNDRPELKFFVMSFCPYGNQMEEVLRPVFDLIGNKADITPHYIFEKITDLKTFCTARSGDPNQCPAYIQNKYFKTLEECKQVITKSNADCLDEKAYIKSSDGTFYSSLHGRQEGNQNVREICAWNQSGNDKKTWWNFVIGINKNCTANNADTCWEQQGKEAGLDTNKITECFNKEAFSLIEKEVSATAQYKISSSPTILINDVLFPPEAAYSQDGKGSLAIGNKVATQDKYRTPNVMKEAICASMKKSAKECNTLLPELSGAPPSAGGCGN